MRNFKRLTEIDEFGNFDIIGVNCGELQFNLEFDEINLVTDALNKLAAYEDAGLTPDEALAACILINNYRDIASEKYSWNSLMRQLDDCYPAKIYTGVSGDIGPLIVVKLREIDALRKQDVGI